MLWGFGLSVQMHGKPFPVWGSHNTLLAVLLMAQPCALPFFLPLSLTSFPASFVALPHTLPFPFSPTMDTSCICAPSPYTWNTQPLPLLLSLLSSPFPHTALLYFITLQTYFGERLSPSPLFSYSCNFRPGARTLCNTYTVSPFSPQVLPSVWQGCVFLWASCSSMNCIVAKTWYYISARVQI